MQMPKPLPISQRATPDEADNLVMQRTPAPVETMVQDVVDPEIPITPAQQTVSTQQAATRAPAELAPTSIPAPQPMVSSADTSYDAIAGQLDQQQSMLEKEKAERIAEANKKSLQVQEQLDKINANPVQIDNRSLWAKSSTGQKVVLAMGALLSSLNPNSAKAFQDTIQSTIETDLKLQMDALNSQRADKNSLLAQMEKITGDRDAASNAYRAQIYGILSNKLSLTAQKAQSKQQREIALMNADLAKQKQMMEFSEMQTKLEEKRSEGTIPGYSGTIKDAAEARKFKDAVTASENITNALTSLKEINKIPFKSLRPQARADAESALGQITAELKTFKELGTLDKGVEALVDKMIQNPTNFFSFDSSNKSKIMNFQKYITDGLNKKAQVLGLKAEGVPSTFRKE
jgi:demethoxyubiquinone hydroxylase (CLK1/Coq7/Cat5 family)